MCKFSQYTDLIKHKISKSLQKLVRFILSERPAGLALVLATPHEIYVVYSILRAYRYANKHVKLNRALIRQQNKETPILISNY